MRSAKLYLQDIIEAISRLEDSFSGRSKEYFLKNCDLQDTTARRLEVIGEAAKNIPSDIKLEYPKIPWKSITGTRDILIHAYFTLDLERIWVVVQKDIPILKKEVQKILKELKEN